MDELKLEAALVSWGRYYGERAPSNEELAAAEVVSMEGAYGRAGGVEASGGYGTNPIATAMSFGSKHDASNPLAYSRPREAVRHWRDPCAGTPTRVARGALHFAGASHAGDPIAASVERAAIELFRINTSWGLVLRAQYCKRGAQTDKVAWINSQGRATSLTLRTYRAHLAMARAWMMGRLGD